jgi:type IV secretory pathway VirB2 component (pilin)
MLFAPLWIAGSPPGVPGAPPDVTKLPGAPVLKDLMSGVEGWALIAAIVGIVVGGIIWAFGQYSQNYQQAYAGRKGVLISAVAAVLIGGAPQIVNFFYGQGGHV